MPLLFEQFQQWLIGQFAAQQFASFRIEHPRADFRLDHCLINGGVGHDTGFIILNALLVNSAQICWRNPVL